MNLEITHIDTACILLEINGYKILTDPCLDNGGKYYHHGYGAISKKTGNPSISNIDLNDIDLVLLSHHHHKDNFDKRGKEVALTAKNFISTRSASKAMKGVVGLNNWDSYSINTNKLTNLKITATPAQHRPWWLPKFIEGEVIGFVIAFDEQENGVIYISGDTVYFKGIDEIGSKFNIDIGVFHLGSAQFRYLTGPGKFTMDSRDLIKSVQSLNPNKIIPIHYKGWSHFKEKEGDLRNQISKNESILNKTMFLASGIKTKLYQNRGSENPV